ncbi:hypothetical protein SELR_15860 [Selenomonas ruminantium subsp. lactilytica TAM6421]|uniref:Uncharacterized protein n=1 Tax=Selenomonas ruminantium subsp. lactilytica (strain NBRC 103574 / TAM6421) TaxID=927704 RepID=I0GRA7_SELRL|nr:hypothetical protein [Selenomonas ruminantium]BAL83294.1 hypothetical protein SELR_15860 [Selenomonas ruminantium subsp. lactilytica TAM6421]
MKQRVHDSQSKGEKSVIVLAVLVLMLVSFCLFGIICEPDSGYEEEKPNIVTAADNGSDTEGPRIVGGFVPERHMGPPQPKEAPLFLSWDFINGLFVVIILFEIIVFPLLFWLWFGKQQHMEEQSDRSN